MQFIMDKSKSKNGDSLSKKCALFNWSQWENLIYHLFEIRIINIKQVI